MIKLDNSQIRDILNRIIQGKLSTVRRQYLDTLAVSNLVVLGALARSHGESNQ